MNEGTVTLSREPQDVPDLMGDDAIRVVPFHASETLQWCFVDSAIQTTDNAY